MIPGGPGRAARARRRARGFTLIEVLVALMIVAFGMSAVFVALTTAANSTMRLREKSFAEWVGFNQLATVRLTPVAPLVGTSEGDAVFAGIRWHCLQTVENMPQIPGLLRVTIQVRYADASSGGQTGAQSATGSGSASDNALTSDNANNVSATSRCIVPGTGNTGGASSSSTSLTSGADSALGADSSFAAAGSASSASSGGAAASAASADATSVSSNSAGGHWLATVVGFYGLGPLVTAPVGILTWDTATAGSSSGATGTTGTTGTVTSPSPTATPVLPVTPTPTTPSPLGGGTP